VDWGVGKRGQGKGEEEGGAVRAVKAVKAAKQRGRTFVQSQAVPFVGAAACRMQITLRRG